MTIEDQARAMLGTVLGECIRQRTELGIQKYGQRLDDNPQPYRAKAIHLIQELLDAMQYAIWVGDRVTARKLARMAEGYARLFSLTAEEIMAGGKQ